MISSRILPVSSRLPNVSRLSSFCPRLGRTYAAAAIQDTRNRAEGSIADAFASLSKDAVELPPRFRDLKRELIAQQGEAIVDSWHRLLQRLNQKTLPEVRELGSAAIPEINYSMIAENGGKLPKSAEERLKACGTIIVRNIVSEVEALGWKQQVRAYIDANPSTKGFPTSNIQVYELYWSTAQLAARSHPHMLATQVALNQVWSRTEDDKVILSEPVAYCDRLRMRTPGDKSFNLGPHLDGGSLERWEDQHYRKCYADIFEGNWEKHDPFVIGPRLDACMDMYQGPGGCSGFRTYQGWLSLSNCAPGDGTLRVLPDLVASNAYTLLRPFVTPLSPLTPLGQYSLDADSSIFQGATMGAGQELTPTLHPHIAPATFVSIPAVRPGDAVFWHCDVAHMVENEHNGKQDASVFYIPAAPLCTTNARYLKRQRDNFLEGTPPPDFPGGIGESKHVGRAVVENLSLESKRAMGCAKFDEMQAKDPGELKGLKEANGILGF